MGDDSVFCDELGLMGLCSLYNKHCVVLTKDKLWSSIEADHPMKLMELFKACTLRLVYLGKLRFGILKWRPKPPPVPKATPNVQFKIVEEYTLDDTNTINLCAPKIKEQEHVETLNHPESNCVITEGNNKQGTSMTNEPANSSLVDDPEHVETPSASLQLVKYPWMKKLSVEVERLHELNIDIWCNKVSDYYRYRSAKCTFMGKVKDNKTTSDPTPDQLISRAKSLINQSKEWIDSAVVVKGEPVDKGVALVEVTGTKLHVETDDKKKALSSLHAVTIAKLRPPSDEVLRVGTVDNTSIPPTSKKNRSVFCKMCEKSFPSVRELNTHHRADHGIVKCHHCSKAVGTRTALDKHMYNHGNMDFLCVTCGKRFAFQSRLDQHKLVHQTESSLECTEPNCSKKFKSIGDYNRHLKTHQDGGWYLCDFCTYKNKDKRNTMSHMRTHTKKDEGRYECDKCLKRMRYSTQFIRHKQQGCRV